MSWIESIVANMAIICFYDLDKYLFQDICQPYSDRLSSVGILHESGDSPSASHAFFMTMWFVLGVI